jgi:hypothetical protein
MQSIHRGLAAMLFVLPLAACSGDAWITGGDLVEPGTATGTIEVVNATSDQLHAVLISNCDTSTYGLNRLPEGMAIPSGGRYQWTVSAGCWDVDAGTFGVGEARQRMSVAAGGITQYTVTD